MRKGLLLLIGAIALVVAGCGDKDDDPPPVYPVKKVLTNWEGQELDVTIVGRTNDELIFTKAGQDKRYNYPIGKLSEDDKKYAHKLPRVEHFEDTPWIKSKRDELRRIETRIEDYEAEIKATPRAQVRVRALQRELDKLKAEKKKLEASIKEDQKKGR